ncbi:MAG: hypothetical protein JST22_21180 [Bacteroidetes bacterium]|nr:hypothetical protein [Bacteroidota bacterium]
MTEDHINGENGTNDEPPPYPRPVPTTSQWWSAHRTRYLRIVIAGTLAAIVFNVIITIGITGRGPGPAFTLFTVIPSLIASGVQCIVWIVLANLIHLTGSLAERMIPARHLEAHRPIAWHALTTLAAGLPMILVAASLVQQMRG